MRSYLSLIPISAKVRRRQNRMTLVCIMIAVFLVTAVFSMADMTVRMETNRAVEKNGNWHLLLQGVEESTAERISGRKDVAAFMWYNTINGNLKEDYYFEGRKAALCATEGASADILGGVTEGHFPENEKEVMLTENAKTSLGIKTGDTVTVEMPTGSIAYTVSGFNKADAAKVMQYDAVIVFMDREAFEKVCTKEHVSDAAPNYYIQLKSRVNARKAIDGIKREYGLTEEQVGENIALLAATGFSTNSYILGLYFVAAVLAALILLAGVFMIAGSLNSNVAERTQFFGMLRCIGASRGQVVKLVRLEALNWCRIAVPSGVVLGILVTWALCAILRMLVSSEFEPMPVFEVSGIGILCGIVIGILTVLIAAKAPAKRAASVSPVMAVSGNAAGMERVRHAKSTRFLRIETTLGIYYAVSAKKNLVLMTGSFALSIILFLSFSVVIEWVHHALNPLRPYAPDCSVMSEDRSSSIDHALAGKIGGQDCIERVFGRMYQNIPAKFEGKESSIDLISYEENQFQWAEKELAGGDMSKVFEDGNFVLVVYDKSNTLAVGDKIELYGMEAGNVEKAAQRNGEQPAGAILEVAGILEDSPFDSTDIPTVICSEETFTKLTGIRDYAVIDMQFRKGVTEEEVNAIHALAGEGYLFSDRRAGNREIMNVYWGFNLFVYGFLAVISLITVLNIINSIAMSVSAKIRQYGAMRAVGMDGRQVTKMIAAETVTYVVLGFFAGCMIGIPLHRLLYHKMITAYFGAVWELPVLPLLVIVLLMVLAAVAAAYRPSKRIREMAVTDVINEL